VSASSANDQQLAAIGAGGVLRDITQTHGALRLTELHRFIDPSEAAASLALRSGNPTRLEFHFDNGRVHVGDLAPQRRMPSRLGFPTELQGSTPS
jgi:hypothetical protein